MAEYHSLEEYDYHMNKAMEEKCPSCGAPVDSGPHTRECDYLCDCRQPKDDHESWCEHYPAQLEARIDALESELAAEKARVAELEIDRDRHKLMLRDCVAALYYAAMALETIPGYSSSLALDIKEVRRVEKKARALLEGGE